MQSLALRSAHNKAGGVTNALNGGEVYIQVFRLTFWVATCHLQPGYNLLKQLATNLWTTSFDSQLTTRLLSTSNENASLHRLVDDKSVGLRLNGELRFRRVIAEPRPNHAHFS